MEFDVARLLKKLHSSPGLNGVDLVKPVTSPEPYEWKDAGAGQKTAKNIKSLSTTAA